MRAPQTKLGQFILLFFAEMISFFIITFNSISYTHYNYFWTAVSDMLFSAQSFIMMKLMMDDSKARSWFAGAGATCGGACGSLLGIFVSKHLHI